MILPMILHLENPTALASNTYATFLSGPSESQVRLRGGSLLITK